MQAAARQLFEAQAGQLRALLEESNKRLEPLGDPLATDFGLHRWLAGDREEAYSDWLQWILQQIQDPRETFRLLGTDVPDGLRDWRGGPPQIGREIAVPQGHAGQAGRLDLVVRYKGHALLVLEIKKTDADQADTAKQAGYTTWLDQQPEPYKLSILLAVDAEEDIYDGFQFLSWADLCLGIRNLARRYCRGRIVVASMALAFAGAVEQNLLGLSSAATAVVNPRIVPYLERWLSENDR